MSYVIQNIMYFSHLILYVISGSTYICKLKQTSNTIVKEDVHSGGIYNVILYMLYILEINYACEYVFQISENSTRQNSTRFNVHSNKLGGTS